MRLLRLTLLSDFFLKKKNFDRANKIINFGIFLAIFALTSSVISFVIERKINSKEFELIIKLFFYFFEYLKYRIVIK